MEKREAECWTSRLGRSPKRRKENGGFRTFTANIPQSTRHPVERLQSILVIAWLHWCSRCLALCSEKKGLPRNVRGRCKRGAQYRLSWPAPLVHFRLDYSLSLCLLPLFIILFWFPFCVLYSWVSLALDFLFLAKYDPLKKYFKIFF